MEYGQWAQHNAAATPSAAPHLGQHPFPLRPRNQSGLAASRPTRPTSRLRGPSRLPCPMTSFQSTAIDNTFVIRHHNYQSQTAYDRNLVLDLLLLPSARQPSKPHHRTKLQAILFPNHALVLLPKLTCQLFASRYVLRTDKINCYFDRICQIGNLKHNQGQLPFDRTPRNRPDVHIPPG